MVCTIPTHFERVSSSSFCIFLPIVNHCFGGDDLVNGDDYLVRVLRKDFVACVVGPVFMRRGTKDLAGAIFQFQGAFVELGCAFHGYCS